MATNPRQAERESSPSFQETSRKIADQAAQTNRTAAETAERMARSSTDAAQRATESIKQTWRDGGEAAGRIAERSIEQFSKVFGMTGDTARETLEQSSSNIQALLESTTIIADGLQQISGEWMRFAQQGIEHNMNRLGRLHECRSVQELVALQTQTVREHLESLLETARRSAEHSTRMAEQASQKISDASLVPR
jgi:hypothetical protein